ncbi:MULTISPECIES: hypothetical protein [unclassified Kitasatospora]|uniref:hypothetical protein n=1 Tax=unclassified Kitasatospora TaxID=2633591 RepID=UPI00070E1960|nr:MULTISPECIES: hypothetical protein [unclassified Kitasatospora]KQV05621.1 hypothetical protein ASC99_12515 [Kitasatospora sp. Root107]KRB62424.1 hypothetical protein ASE03_07465 [Kitasatospora sp. Root187]
MRNIVAGQHAYSLDEFAELALGVDAELFAGVPGESPEERAVRLDVAGAVLEDLRREDFELAAYAERLLRSASVPLVRLAVRRRPPATTYGEAA